MTTPLRKAASLAVLAISCALYFAIIAVICLAAPRARAAGTWEDFALPYLNQLANKSVNGNAPRGLNPDPHFITISPPDWYDAEQAAVSGFSWGTDPTRSAVGGAFRGYTGGSPWAFGIATEAISSPTSHGHVIGAEIDVYSRNGNATDSAKWGINLIFFNRATGTFGNAESGLGGNRYNDGAKAMVIEAQQRSPVGEYSGWQTGFYFGKTALDRTVTKTYASVIDVADVTVDAAWYLVVFRCGDQKCGLKLVDGGLELWQDVEMLPHRVRTY